MKTQKLVAVLIPIYKNELNLYEVISLQRTLQILSNYPIYIIKPQSLTINFSLPKNVLFEDFEDHYFSAIQGYNKLLLSTQFYERFSPYEYILIAQLDVYIFKDELEYWCAKGFDYIGAVWIRGRSIEWKGWRKILQNLSTKFSLYNSSITLHGKVGNGGLSLRKVQKMIEITQSKKRILKYLENKNNDSLYNEDVYFCIEVNRYLPTIKIPDAYTAIQFSIEDFPERCIEKNTNKLPFGCHAWYKEPQLSFWKKYIPIQ